jgi:hypothetical protein
MIENKTYALKPEWQNMTALTEVIADALRADQSGRISEVTASSIALNGEAEGWITVLFPDGQNMHVSVKRELVYGTGGGSKVNYNSYELPAMTGKVSDEHSHISSRFFNLVWSNPTEGPSNPYALDHMPMEDRLGVLKRDLVIHQQMFEQAYRERRTQVPDSHAAALEEAWNILTTMLEEQRADLEAGYDENPRLNSR